MKKGEGLLSFFFTYSWVVLVILIIAGTLVYFRILKPHAILPSKCSFSQNLRCTDYRIDSDNQRINFRLTNSMGSGIIITRIKAQDSGGQIVCEASVNTTGVITSARPFNGSYNANRGWHIPNLEWDDVSLPCSVFSPADEKVAVSFQLIYYLDDASPVFSHIMKGEIIAVPESVKV